MLNLKSKPFLAWLALAAFFTGMVVLVVIPLIGVIRDATLEIRQQKTLANEYEHSISRAREFMAFVKQENEGFSDLGKIFIDNQMPLEFINSLEATAKSSGVSIKLSSSMALQTVKNDWPSVIFDIDINGSAMDALRFAEKIENSPYLASIQSFDVNVGTAFDGTRKTASNPDKARLSLKVYAKPQPK